MWHRVDLVWTDVSEERIAYIFRVEKSASEEPAWAGGCSLLVPRLPIFQPWRCRRYISLNRRFTQDPHGATSQKTAFFIVTPMKASNLTKYLLVLDHSGQGNYQTNIYLYRLYYTLHLNIYWSSRFQMVLMMVYNTQNYWVFGLFSSSGILENTTFRKLDLFLSSGESGGEGVQWLRLALSKGPSWVGVFSPTFSWGWKQIQFLKCHVL
jgi:hypothetical protein